jgi:hypothetical protein
MNSFLGFYSGNFFANARRGSTIDHLGGTENLGLAVLWNPAVSLNFERLESKSQIPTAVLELRLSGEIGAHCALPPMITWSPGTQWAVGVSHCPIFLQPLPSGLAGRVRTALRAIALIKRKAPMRHRKGASNGSAVKAEWEESRMIVGTRERLNHRQHDPYDRQLMCCQMLFSCSRIDTSTRS